MYNICFLVPILINSIFIYSVIKYNAGISRIRIIYPCLCNNCKKYLKSKGQAYKHYNRNKECDNKKRMLHITPHIRLTQYSELQLDLCRTEQIDDLAADFGRTISDT